MDFTLLICTHNRRELLRRTIASLQEAERPAGANLDVLVIANACSDDTLAWLQAEAARSPLRLRWAVEAEAGKARALNRALPLLEKPYVVLLDDDHRVDPSFLAQIHKALENHPGESLLCGRILPDWNGSEPAWVHDRGAYQLYPPPIPMYDRGGETRHLEDDNLPGGGNLIVRTELFRRLGSFNTALGPRGHNFVGGEDSEFLRRARASGEKLLYVPAILQYHHVDPRRLRLGNLMKMSYERSRCVLLAGSTGNRGGIPPYMWKKLFLYLLGALCSLNPQKIRFHLVRIAALWGEMSALRKAA